MVYKRINASKIQQKGKEFVITNTTTKNQNEILARSVIGSLSEDISDTTSLIDATVGGKHMEIQAWY